MLARSARGYWRLAAVFWLVRTVLTPGLAEQRTDLRYMFRERARRCRTRAGCRLAVEPGELNFNPLVGSSYDRVSQYLIDIWVEIHHLRAVNHDVCAGRKTPQGSLQASLIQERDIFAQNHADRLARLVRTRVKVKRRAVVLVKDEENTHEHANHDARQQIRKNNSGHGDNERNELVAPSLPHLLKECRFG